MSNDKPNRHEAVIRGRKTTVSVPQDPAPEQILIDAIKENLTPEAVALIAAKCQPVYAGCETGQRAERECAWFARQLIQALGQHEYETICNELGL